MNSQHTSLNRRRVIELAGVSTAGVVGFSRRTLAEESDPNVTIEVSDQESDGESIVINSLETDVDGLLQVFKNVDERPVYKSMHIYEGTKFTDRTIDLDDQIPETQSIRISLYPPEGGRAFDGMSAEVFISETVDGAESIDGTGYGTEPGVQKIEADPDAGFHSPYFVYTPTTSPSAVDPNGTETVELKTTFEETGEFTLSVNETTVRESVVVTEETTEADGEESTELETEDPSSEEDTPSEPSDELSDVGTERETSDESGPGFGVLQSIAALGGLGYLLKRMFSDGKK